MKINVFPIVSSLHEASYINEETKKLLDELEVSLNANIEIVSLDKLYDGDLALILIQSGGSEQSFLANLAKFKEPYYLLTYGTNNSLAASLEILSYLKDNNLKGEVLHGSVSYLTSKIKGLTFKLKPKKLGVIGKPSDWLIASNVNYKDAKEIYNINLIDIAMDEVLSVYNKASSKEVIPNLEFEHNALHDSFKLLNTLSQIKDKYLLDGLTIRCFDLLGTIKTTACLSLAYFNSLGITSTCEGDIPSLVTMEICNYLFSNPGFQANPSQIDSDNNTIIFAHCTLPLNMTNSYTLDTHYESGIGVAIRGKLKEDKVTIFKLSRDLKHYFVSSGKILENLNEDNLCRTQIKVKIDHDINYFLTRPYGNHHIIIYGNHEKEINDFMKSILE